jgi:uncharacterized RDD family membrane protein YckC
MPSELLNDPYSAWWRRVIAELVDFTIVTAITSLLLLVVGEHALWYRQGGHLASNAVFVRYIAVDLAALLYYPLLMWHLDGQTIGKRLLRIRVVRTDGRRMSLSRATWREFVLKFVVLDLVGLLPRVGLAFGEIVFLLDGLWPLWDPENRALHDMLAGTRVVRSTSVVRRSMSEIVSDVREP